MSVNATMFSAFATLVAALIAAGVTIWIARNQLRIAEDQRRIAAAKLRLDLYNRRFDIFSKTIALLRETEKHKIHEPISEIFDKVRQEFIISKFESKFLFDKEVSDVFETIFKKASIVTGCKEHPDESKSVPDPQERAAYNKRDDERIERESSLSGDMKLLEEKIGKYMNFHTLDGI